MLRNAKILVTGPAGQIAFPLAEHLARAYGWEYTRVTTRTALDQVLTAPVVGRQLIEVPLPR